MHALRTALWLTSENCHFLQKPDSVIGSSCSLVKIKLYFVLFYLSFTFSCILIGSLDTGALYGVCVDWIYCKTNVFFVNFATQVEMYVVLLLCQMSDFII